MGIKEINTFIKKKLIESTDNKYNDFFAEIELNNIKGLNIAIDFDNVINRMKQKAKLLVIDNTNIKFDEDNGWSDINSEVISIVLYRLLYKFVSCLKLHRIKGIFVIDGKYPEEKKDEQDRRRLTREQNYEKLINLRKDKESYKKYISYLKRIVFLSKQEKTVCQDIILYFDMDIYVANGEAEKLCSQFCFNGDVFAVYSNDTDLYAHGCPICIRNIKNYYTNKPIIEVAVLKDILKTIFYDFDEIKKIKSKKQRSLARKDLFIVFCCFIGNDNMKRVKGMGPVRILNILKKYFKSYEDDYIKPIQLINIIKEKESKFDNDYVNIYKLFTDKIDGKKIERKSEFNESMLLKKLDIIELVVKYSKNNM